MIKILIQERERILYVPSLVFVGVDPLTRFLSAMRTEPFLLMPLFRFHDTGRDALLDAITTMR